MINQYVVGGIVGLALALLLHMRGQAYAYAAATSVFHKKKKKHRRIRTPAQQQHLRSHRRYARSHPKDTRLIHGTSARHVGGQFNMGDIPGHPESAATSMHQVNDPNVIKPSKKFRGGGTRIWGDLTASETEPHFM